MAIPVTSLAVASHLARTTFGFPATYMAASVYFGSNVLQCPHHGA